MSMGVFGGTVFSLLLCLSRKKTRKTLLEFSLLVSQLWMGDVDSGVFLPMVVMRDTERSKPLYSSRLF